MAWLSLTFGWLLFAIFLTGAVTYYRYEISLWMQPQLVSMQVNQGTAVKSAYSYLEKHAPDAKSWYIRIANQASPVNKIYWQKADGGYERKTLDASTGKELSLSATQGGDFLIAFIFSFTVCPMSSDVRLSRLRHLLYLFPCFQGLLPIKKS